MIVLGLTEAKLGAQRQPLPPSPQAAMPVKTCPTFAICGTYSGCTTSKKERDTATEQLRLEMKTVRYEYVHAGASSSDFQSQSPVAVQVIGARVLKLTLTSFLWLRIPVLLLKQGFTSIGRIVARIQTPSVAT